MASLTPEGQVPIPPYEFHDSEEHRRLLAEAIRSLRTKVSTLENYLETNDIEAVVDTFTGLTDTPSSLTAGNLYQGNSGATALEALAPGSSGNVATSDGSAWTSAAPPTDPAGRLIAIIEDQKTSSHGGTFTSGADQTRDLNTLVYNRDSTVTLSSNQFELPAGDYEIWWSAPAKRCDGHQSFLYDVTNSTEIARGSSEMAGRNTDVDTENTEVQNRSVGCVRVSLSAATTFEIRHRCETTTGTEGFGYGSGFGTEVFTRVVIRENSSSGGGGGGGGGGGTWEILQEPTSITTNDTTIPFFSGSDTAADFRMIAVYITGLHADSSDAVRIQFRQETGGSWITSGYDYVYVLRNANNSHFSNQSSSSANIVISDRCGSLAAESGDIYIYIPYPGKTSRYRNCWWNAAIMGSTPHHNFTYGSGSTVATDAIDAVRISIGGTSDLAGADVEIWGVRV